MRLPLLLIMVLLLLACNGASPGNSSSFSKSGNSE